MYILWTTNGESNKFAIKLGMYENKKYIFTLEKKNDNFIWFDHLAIVKNPQVRTQWFKNLLTEICRHYNTQKY